MDTRVMYTQDGKCYHKFRNVKAGYSSRMNYVQSVCGILDSVIWNVNLSEKDYWFIQDRGLRPCKRCYRT